MACLMASSILHSASHSLAPTVTATRRSHHVWSMVRWHANRRSPCWSWRNHWIAKWSTWRTDLRLSSSNTTSMRCPIELEAFVWATRNLLAIQRMEYISCSLEVWKLHKTVPNWLPGFVPDELHTGDSRYLVKLLSYVVLIHPRLNITNPESSRIGWRVGTWLILVWSRHSCWWWCLCVHLHLIHIICLKVLSLKY